MAKKSIRANEGSILTKVLRKAIMNRNHLRDRFAIDRTDDNKAAVKKQGAFMRETSV